MVLVVSRQRYGLVAPIRLRSAMGQSQPISLWSERLHLADHRRSRGDLRRVLGAPGCHAMVDPLRGKLVREVSTVLPEEIDLAGLRLTHPQF